MPNSFSSAQIERLKREAKQLCRATPNLTHSQALDHIASKHGYNNWSLLTKHSDAGTIPSEAIPVPPPISSRPAFEFMRTTDEMRQAVRKIPEPRFGYYGASPENIARSQVDRICDRFVSMENAVDFAISYMSILLTVPRYRIYGASKVYEEMRCWFPYCACNLDGGRQILVNRRYKPVGETSADWVDYAQFPHLHTQLQEPQLFAITPRGASKGYLFYDGCPPWDSRQDAEGYLTRLRLLQAMLKS